ncbi:MAG: glycosyltransferase family 4 protein [Ferrimicrobium sp.]
MQILFQGNTRFDNSYGIVNLNMADSLRALGHHLRVESWDQSDHDCAASCRLLGLAPFDSGESLSPPDVCIRQFWPPRWDRPDTEFFIVIQQWEYGGIPESWASSLQGVDEVWVHSRFVKSCWVQGGVTPSKVRVVPIGTHRVELPVIDKKANQLLFLGGGIWRKGVDILIRSLDRLSNRELTSLSLVIKESGIDSYYKDQSLVSELLEHFPRVAAQVELIRHSLPRAELDELIAQSQVLVHPYRAEGFYLGGIEAMGLGTQLVTTRGGATDDYANDDNALLVNASFMVTNKQPIDMLGPRRGRNYWQEAHIDELANVIRRALDPSKPELESRLAAAHATAAQFSWAEAGLAADRAIMEARSGVLPEDNLVVADRMVQTVLREWSPASLIAGVRQLLEIGDLYGAYRLMSLGVEQLDADWLIMHRTLGATLPRVQDIWFDAMFRKDIEISLKHQMHQQCQTAQLGN